MKILLIRISETQDVLEQVESVLFADPQIFP